MPFRDCAHDSLLAQLVEHRLSERTERERSLVRVQYREQKQFTMKLLTQLAEQAKNGDDEALITLLNIIMP